MSYPPVLSEAASIELLSIATDYALSHTLVYRPPAASSSSKPSTSAVIHAPYALFPALYPRHLFELAQQLQQSYNLLYVLAALDDEFLEEVIGGAVEELDEFQRELFKIWKITQREGLAQVCRASLVSKGRSGEISLLILPTSSCAFDSQFNLGYSDLII